MLVIVIQFEYIMVLKKSQYKQGVLKAAKLTPYILMDGILYSIILSVILKTEVLPTSLHLFNYTIRIPSDFLSIVYLLGVPSRIFYVQYP